MRKRLIGSIGLSLFLAISGGLFQHELFSKSNAPGFSQVAQAQTPPAEVPEHYILTFQNETGQVITNLRLKPSTEDNWTGIPNHLPAGNQLADSSVEIEIFQGNLLWGAPSIDIQLVTTTGTLEFSGVDVTSSHYYNHIVLRDHEQVDVEF